MRHFAFFCLSFDKNADINTSDKLGLSDLILSILLLGFDIGRWFAIIYLVY